MRTVVPDVNIKLQEHDLLPSPIRNWLCIALHSDSKPLGVSSYVPYSCIWLAAHGTVKIRRVMQDKTCSDNSQTHQSESLTGCLRRMLACAYDSVVVQAKHRHERHFIGSSIPSRQER